jgi:hypothetical protein
MNSLRKCHLLEKACGASTLKTCGESTLKPLEAHIAELKRLLAQPDNEIENTRTDIMQRNRGLQQMLYLHPPIYLYFHPLPLFFKSFFSLCFFSSLFLNIIFS